MIKKTEGLIQLVAGGVMRAIRSRSNAGPYGLGSDLVEFCNRVNSFCGWDLFRDNFLEAEWDSDGLTSMQAMETLMFSHDSNKIYAEETDLLAQDPKCEYMYRLDLDAKTIIFHRDGKVRGMCELTDIYSNWLEIFFPDLVDEIDQYKAVAEVVIEANKLRRKEEEEEKERLRMAMYSSPFSGGWGSDEDEDEDALKEKAKTNDKVYSLRRMPFEIFLDLVVMMRGYELDFIQIGYQSCEGEVIVPQAMARKEGEICPELHEQDSDIAYRAQSAMDEILRGSKFENCIDAGCSGEITVRDGNIHWTHFQVELGVSRQMGSFVINIAEGLNPKEEDEEEEAHAF